MSEGTIVEQLQTQRTLLVDVVHQVEAAIKALGGTITPNGNGNGNGTVGTVKATSGKGAFWSDPAKRAKALRKSRRTIRKNGSRIGRPRAQPGPVTGTNGGTFETF